MSPDLWTAYWAFVAFVFGAITGSFLNVCVWRLPRGESLSDPPSHCPSCNHRLAFLPDMVPILSQLWYRSRCRYCGEKFSWRYLWVEVFCAVVFTGIYLRYVPFSPTFLSETVLNSSATLGMLFAAALITIFFIDLETYTIPDIAVVAALVFAIGKDVLLIGAGHRPLWQSIPGTPWSLPIPLSILGAVGALWLLWQFAALASAALGREAMGAGDSLLLSAMGAFLVPAPLLAVAFMAAVLLGTIGGIIGMAVASQNEAGVPAAGGGELARAEEHGEREQSSAEVVGMSRGAVLMTQPDGPTAGEAADASDAGISPEQTEPEEEADPTEFPPESRWGRLITVAGTWLAVGGVWLGLILAARNAPLGVAICVVALVGAAAAIAHGWRVWASGDKECMEAMDELFEGDPGPRFIPFGPYLVAGTFVAMFAGRQLIEWYWVKNMGLPPLVLPWD